MFERFTLDARRTVVLAQEQARQLQHNYIGTEHLLLALLAAEETSAAEALRITGLRLETVRDEVLGIVGRGEQEVHGRLPFTPRAKKVLELSLREALRLKHKSIEPEHILLGIIREGEGLAAQILVKHGGDLAQLRQEVIFRFPVQAHQGRRGARVPDPRFTLMTPGAARVAERASAHAEGKPVASQHYLLGLLDTEDSLAARALAALGISRAEVETKLAELGTEGTSDEPPERAGARKTSLQVLGNVIALRFDEAELAARLRPHFERLKTDVLRGAELPGAERLWKAVLPAVVDVAGRLEEQSGKVVDWQPPGWANAGVATYSVVSRPDGPEFHLWVAEGADEAEVREWLAGWLRSKTYALEEPCVYFSVAVGRMGDVVPDAQEPEAFTISSFSCGPGPAPADWPRLPLRDLVAAAYDNLG